jgi:hypothetical protein
MGHLLHALAYLTPALALLALLALRRYPGERALLATIARRRAPRPARERAHSTGSFAPRPRALLPRGGRLIARALAVRPPPALGLAAH